MGKRGQQTKGAAETPPAGDNIVKCPRCGGAMEFGYLGSEGLVGGVKWFREKTVLALGGESIAEPNMAGMVYIDAVRCRPCRVVIFKHPEPRKGP